MLTCSSSGGGGSLAGSSGLMGGNTHTDMLARRLMISSRSAITGFCEQLAMERPQGASKGSPYGSSHRVHAHGMHQPCNNKDHGWANIVDR
jgi:hypothetical protein